MLCILYLLFICLVPQHEADDESYAVGGTVFSISEDGTPEPVAGATVTLISGRDTLYTVSDRNGHYKISFEECFEVDLEVSCMGYEHHREKYQLLSKYTSVSIQLKPSAEEIEGATVVGEMTFMTRIADTTKFNAAAMDKMEGDRAYALLSQIPGFEVKDRKLYIWGEPIEKTYINGKLIYGDNPLSALALLGAGEIKSIDVYDQQSDLDKHRGKINSKKVRVLNLETFSSFLASTDIIVQARGGADEKKDSYSGNVTPRYSAGGDFAYNSEMLQAALSTNANNICDKTNSFDIIAGNAPTLTINDNSLDLDFSMTKKWKDAQWGNSLSVDYSYKRDRTESSSRTERTRIAGAGSADDVLYAERQSDESCTKLHEIGVSVNMKQTKIKDFEVSMDAAFDEDNSLNSLSVLESSAGTGMLSQNQSNSVYDRGYSLSPSFRWSNPDAKNGWMPGFIGKYCYSHNISSSVEVDTLASSYSKKHLSGQALGDSHLAEADLSLSKILLDKDSYTLELEAVVMAKYDKRSQSKFTIDNLHQSAAGGDSLDITNSYRYSFNDFDIGPGAKLMLDGKYLNFFLQAGATYKSQKDDESFPASLQITRHYFIPDVIARVELAKSLAFTFSRKCTVPSIEQSRERLDNTNSLRLTLGNPDLKPSALSSFIMFFHTPVFSKGSQVKLALEYDKVKNAIVDKVTYYSQPGIIHPWGTDYTVPAGATLTTFENADGTSHLSINAQFSQRAKAIKGNYSIGILYQHNNCPQYDGESLNRISSSKPSLKYELGTMPFPKNLRLKFSGSSKYIREKNNSGVLLAEAFVQDISASAELRFLQHAFANACYTCTIRKNLSAIGSDADFQNLNWAIGYRFLKGNLGISISGNDMLNKANGYTLTSTSSEVIQNWRPSFGRYYLLNIAYRFNEKK